MEIDEKTMDKIDELSEAGNQFFDEGQYDEAIKEYKKALVLVPPPKIESEAATWIYAALGDSYFSKHDYQASLNSFLDAYKCPGGISNPFILFRIGQCYFYLQDEKNATEFLLKAYMLDGEKIFRGEEKFLEFLSSKVKL